jgi:hypothetical protein
MVHPSAAAVASLRDPDIEALVGGASGEIDELAERLRVTRRDVELELRLHLPLYARSELQGAHGAKLVRDRLDALIPRLAEHAHSTQIMMRRAGWPVDSARAPLLIRRGGVIATEQGTALTRGALAPVDTEVARTIERELHYLRWFREDSDFRLGMALDPGRPPLSYVSLGTCDRSYIKEAALRVLPETPPEELAVLSRVYALPGAPKNILSWSIAAAAKHLREQTVRRYMVTALNPMLGFTGASFFSSNFRAFATAPVDYAYSSDRFGHCLEYTTRRSGRSVVGGLLDTPPNALLITGLDTRSRHKVSQIDRIIHIEESDYRSEAAAPASMELLTQLRVRRLLGGYRDVVEAAWGPDTAYPGYVHMDTQPSRDPSGQCGVTSAWLQETLWHRHGILSVLCRGRLSFDQRDIQAVPDHCWLEVGDRSSPDRVIIDITGDQARGFTRRIVCDTVRRLAAEGIHFAAMDCFQLDELETNRVMPRLRRLLDRLAYSAPAMADFSGGVAARVEMDLAL